MGLVDRKVRAVLALPSLNRRFGRIWRGSFIRVSALGILLKLAYELGVDASGHDVLGRGTGFVHANGRGISHGFAGTKHADRIFS